MKKGLVVKLHGVFEKITQQHDKNLEFWYARDIQKLLGYDEWRNFLLVVEKAKIACKTSKNPIKNHFVDVNKMVGLGSKSQRQIDDIELSRYACYLIAQNGDSRKPEIAFAQTYFAVQTRKQEIVEKRLGEVERLYVREKLSNSEKILSGVLFERGVDGQGYARIRSKGDQALFNGKNTQQMKKQLKVPEKRALSDFLPGIVIKAKDFANEITTFNSVRDDLQGEGRISVEHVKNNKNVRKLLTDQNIYPEKLPAAEDIRKVDRKIKLERESFEKTGGRIKKIG